MTVMGFHEFKYTEGYWLRTVVWQGVSDPDPSRTVLGVDRIGNLSLRTALARYLDKETDTSLRAAALGCFALTVILNTVATH